MASEDSDHVVARYLAIHRLCDLEDAGKSLTGEVFATPDDLEALHKFLEVTLLWYEADCSERTALSPFEYRLDGALSTHTGPLCGVLAAIRLNFPDAEEQLESLQ